MGMFDKFFGKKEQTAISGNDKDDLSQGNRETYSIPKSWAESGNKDVLQAKAILEQSSKFKDINDYFIEKMHQNGLNEKASREIVSNVFKCLALNPLDNYGIEISLPYSLCIRKKLGFKTIGVVQNPANINKIEILLKVVFESSIVNIGNFSCMNIKIGDADYPFYIMKTGEKTNVDSIPEGVIIITDKNTAISYNFYLTHFYKDFAVVTEKE